ncbi:MAG: flap endonuclease [Dehalococcoidia bacterium]|nr:flap endonuclease [Dehalococcoidia bacterium]
MQVHLIDGTYELFRHYFAVPSRLDAAGRERGAVVGVLASVVRMLEDGTTHLGVATDHVIESFRNELWVGYKTGAGMDPVLFEQFAPLEDALRALGVVVWPMVEFEADDALAAAAARSAAAAEVERVFVCTPDKDLAQCVVEERVVQLDRRAGTIRDAAGVEARFGVRPASIPDYLALVGDTADGFPGLAGWGAKSTATVLGRYGRLEEIPADASTWDVRLARAAPLNTTLRDHWSDALLFRDLATLRTDIDVFLDIDELRWRGPGEDFEAFAGAFGAPELASRAAAVAAHR